MDKDEFIALLKKHPELKEQLRELLKEDNNESA